MIATSVLERGPELERLPAWAGRIRRCRIKMGWSQQQLAQKLNQWDPSARCDANVVSRWERGRHVPSWFYQDLLCRAFEPVIADASKGRAATERRALVREAMGFWDLEGAAS
jgi:transcriptional regulator with XRE-family HTH domain